MKNITLALPDDVYRQARVEAAALDTSVSALVRDFLIGLSDSRAEFQRRERLQSETLESVRTFRAGDRAGRDELHRRRR